MSEKFLIKSVANGKAVKVNEMLAEFQEQNQDNSIFSPFIKFTDDIMHSKNAISFLCQIKELSPVATFETIFPKDVSDPALIVNSIINYLNVYPSVNNRFILKIGGTDERKRKERFGGQAHGLSDISKMFAKQPLSKKKPILEISSADVDARKLADFFPPEKFVFSVSEDCIGNAEEIEKEMKAAGYEPEPYSPERSLL